MNEQALTAPKGRRRCIVSRRESKAGAEAETSGRVQGKHDQTELGLVRRDR